jgi:hypothetical protein
VTAFATGVWACAGNSRRGRIVAAMLAGYAATGMATGLFMQMDRREVIAAGESSLRNSFHAPGTMVQSIFLIAAMITATRLFGRNFRYYSYATVIVLLLFGAWTSLQIGQMEANEPTPWMGLKERVNIYGTMLWIAVLAIALLRATSPSSVGADSSGGNR